jgi:SAM-dependent methyltransferase
MNKACPCCLSENSLFLKNSDGYAYYKCQSCFSLFIDPEYLEKIDSGFNIIKYEEGYWKMELESARERSYGPSLARAAEAIYYCRRPIKKFLDIGTGPGYFLDAIEKLVPGNAHIFYGVELFPPEPAFRTRSKNYIIGDLGDIKEKFDCGICVEVIEHLTPTMLNDIFKKLADASNPEALYIFNTGMPDYVLNEDIAYLDPTRRGHLVSYSLPAIELIAGKYGFTTHRIQGKTWAFAVEYTKKSGQAPEDIRDRVWTALAQNLNILTDSNMGSVLKLLGLETSRAYN